MAQHARPNVTGQMADRRAHWTIFSTVVVRTGISMSAMMFLRASSRRPDPLLLPAPIKGALAPYIDVASQQQAEERRELPEPAWTEVAQRDGPRVQEGYFDVEEQEDHRDEVELYGLTLTGVADRRHAAFVRRGFFGGRLARSEELGKQDRPGSKPNAQADHDQDGPETLHQSPTARLYAGRSSSNASDGALTSQCACRCALPSRRIRERPSSGVSSASPRCARHRCSFPAASCLCGRPM